MEGVQEVFVVEFEGLEIPILCKLALNKSATTNAAGCYRIVDVLASCYSDNTLVDTTAGILTQSLESFLPGSAAVTFFRTLAEQLKRSPCRVLLAKLIVPGKAGHVASTMILQDRLVDFPLELKVLSFISFSQQLVGVAWDNPLKKGLTDLLSVAAGAIVVTADVPLGGNETSSDIDAFLAAQLNMSWICDQVVPKATIGLVGGRPQIALHQPISDAARSLGISLVLFERQGHWLERDDYLTKTLRMEFIPLGMEPDDNLHLRIVAAVDTCPVKLDGIFTTFDEYLVSVAKAAEILGFPTQPPAAYDIATDKYLTRIQPDVMKCDPVIAAADTDHLQEVLTSDERKLEYPVIVKPRRGCGSEGVSKARDASELLQAADRPESWDGKGLVIERYVDGPEVDANFVLCQGEILFFEVSDDLPSKGDEPNTNVKADFSERGMVFPSALPQSEITEIKTSIHKSLLSMGFDTGVFHAEARVQNSTMKFETNEEGHLDLQTRQLSGSKSPSCFLLEVNARQPGVFASIATQHTYGVNYLSLAMLAALGDHSRMRILSKSFNYPDRRNAQYHNQLVLISSRTGGKIDLDICSRLRDRYPALVREYVATCGNTFQQGSTVPDPGDDGVGSLLAWFNVKSRKSREDAMKAAYAIENAVHHILGWETGSQ